MKCENHCPQCGSTDIEWGGYEYPDGPVQEAVCNDCDCSFIECYAYSETIIR